jgi:hypothetical protein
MSEHDEQPVLVRRHELFHMVEQMSGRARIRRQGKPEHRWPVTTAVIGAIVLQYLLPGRLILGVGHLHYVLLGLDIALLLALIAANPVRIERRSRPVRAGSVALIAAITAGNAVSAALLVVAILTGAKVSSSPTELLLAAGAIWGTNVVAFALWYWEFDRGGPVSRLEASRPYPLGQAHHTGAVGGVARACRSRHRPGGQHPAVGQPVRTSPLTRAVTTAGNCYPWVVHLCYWTVT